MDTMPSTYDSQYGGEQVTASHTTHVESSRTTTNQVPIGLNAEYIKTIPAILKIVEMVLNIIILICVGVVYFYHATIGWTNFVAVITLLASLLFFIFYLINVIYRLPGPWVLIEFITWVVCAAFHLIALICCAVLAFLHSGLIAAAVFLFCSMVVYAVDAFFTFNVFRISGASLATGTQSSTTTTTTHQEAYVTH